MQAAERKSTKRKMHHSTSPNSSSSSSSDSAGSSPKKRRTKKKERASTNSYAANSDAEAQLLLQQRQALKLTKQKSFPKGSKGLEAHNHSTEDQPPTEDILSRIDSEEDADCKTDPKWQTKLTLDQLKEKSKHLLVSEDCPNLPVLCTNKKVLSQPSNTQKKADLQLRNLQKNIEKATIELWT